MPEPAVLTWLRLARVFQKIDRASLAHLRSWKLNVAQFDVLAQVGSTLGITQQELADRLLVTKGNISQLIDRMEQHGLLTRQQEGRTNILSLTPAGQQLYQKVVPAQEALITFLFSTLSKQELEQLRAVLRKLDHDLG
jgi:DNA-binding MarR family transcriptional regulator